MDVPSDSTTMPHETAERIVGFIAYQDGVQGATVATLDGGVLATSGPVDSARDGTLGAFVCERAEELCADGDLRGMGKLVAGSAFHELSIHGARGEGLIMRLEGGCLVLSAEPGQLAAAARSVTPVTARFGRPTAGR